MPTEDSKVPSIPIPDSVKELMKDLKPIGGTAPIKPFASGDFSNPNLNTDLEASVKRLEELRADRNLTDIPLDDEYWSASRKHQFAFATKK